MIIDSDGIVRHASSVGPPGKRNIEELLAEAKKINGDKKLPPPAPKGKVASDATLYVRENCRFCQSTLKALKNLHIEDAVKVRDVEKDPEARKALDALAPASKVPALVQNGLVQHESADIIRTLAELYALT